MKKFLFLVSWMAFVSVACSEQKQAAVTPGDSKAAVSAETAWMTDFDAAKAKAKADNKYMLLDFSGSDWCGWCIKLDKEVFSTKEFKDFAAQNFVLVMLDYPRSKPQPDAIKAQNEKLSRQYNIEGFPTVLILNPDGKLVEQTGYRAGGGAAYVTYLKSVLAREKK